MSVPAREWPHWSATPCQIWQGHLTPDGYGPHRKSYANLYGPIPPGLTVDHLCRVKACQNPLHMELLTRRENIRRALMVKHGGLRTGNGWPADDGKCR